MRHIASPSRKLLRPFAGWLALVLYVAVASPAGLAITAAFAALDRSHQVVVSAGTGDLRVVLHHVARNGLHHHGLVAQALTLFAQPATESDPDHVLRFSAPTAASECSPPQFAAAEADAPADFLPLPTITWSRRGDFLAAVPTHAPPDNNGPLACLRSTVLLI